MFVHFLLNKYVEDETRECERCETVTVHEHYATSDERAENQGGTVGDEWEVPNEGHYCYLCFPCMELTEEV